MWVLMLDENAYVNYHLLIVKCTGHAKEWPAKNGDDDVMMTTTIQWYIICRHSLIQNFDALATENGGIEIMPTQPVTFEADG